jgi:hypothetical protein
MAVLIGIGAAALVVALALLVLPALTRRRDSAPHPGATFTRR